MIGISIFSSHKPTFPPLPFFPWLPTSPNGDSAPTSLISSPTLPNAQPPPRPTILVLIPRTQHTTARRRQQRRRIRQRVPTPTLLTILRPSVRVALGLTAAHTQLGRHGRRVHEGVRRQCTTAGGRGLGVASLECVRPDRGGVGGGDIAVVAVDAQPVDAAADVGRVSAAGRGAAGLVVGGAGGEARAAVAFGRVFQAGQGEGAREAVGLAFLGRHVGGGGVAAGEGAAGRFVGAAGVSPLW